MQNFTYLTIFILSAFIIGGYSAPTTDCPSGKTKVQCLVNPCSEAECPGDSTATCYADYCGGCNTNWVTTKGTPAQCTVSTSCPPGQMVTCFVNPCQGKTCAEHPGATCVPNYCNGCSFTWVLNGQTVQCDPTS